MTCKNRWEPGTSWRRAKAKESWEMMMLYKIFPKIQEKTLSVNYVTDAYVIDGIKAGVKPAHLRPLGKIQGKRNPYVGCILTHTRQKSMN